MKFYLDNIKQVNNWDLVDLSAPNVLGAYLLVDRDRRSLLYRLAKSSASQLLLRGIADIAAQVFAPHLLLKRFRFYL